MRSVIETVEEIRYRLFETLIYSDERRLIARPDCELGMPECGQSWFKLHKLESVARSVESILLKMVTNTGI